MYRKLFMMSLLWGNVLFFSSKVTAYPGPNICPNGEESVATDIKIYAETSQFYINICKSRSSNQYYLARQQKSDRQYLLVPVEKSNKGEIYSGEGKDKYYYSFHAGQDCSLQVYAGSRKILSQKLLPNLKFYKGSGC
jgi:hypothetical protein